MSLYFVKGIEREGAKTVYSCWLTDVCRIIVCSVIGGNGLLDVVYKRNGLLKQKFVLNMAEYELSNENVSG